MAEQIRYILKILLVAIGGAACFCFFKTENKLSKGFETVACLALGMGYFL